MFWVYQDERFLTEEVPTTVAELQGGSREAKLKEAEGKVSTVGTRTGSEAGCEGELARNGEAQ